MGNNKPSKKLSDRETAALTAAAAVICFFAVYWYEQILSVIELLELAYG